jgi:hypothetical protein
MHLNAVLLSALFSTVALARTDLVGCTSSVSGPLLIWYVPGTGELCDFPDCGGGRAPPKYDNPACIGYTGTSTYSPSYLSGYGGANVAPVTTAVISASTSTSWSAPATTTTGISAGSGSSDKSGEAEGSSSGTFFAQTTFPVVTSPVTTPPATTAVSSSRSASSLAVTKSASASTSSSTGAAPRASSGIGAGAVAVAAGLVGVAML